MNKIMISGNLTQNADLRYLNSGTPVLDFRLASNRRWKDRDGNKKEEVCYVDCTLFGKRAEGIARYLGKGTGIIVEGYLKYETWEDQRTGGKRSKHKIMVMEIEFLPGNRRDDGRGGRDDRGRRDDRGQRDGRGGYQRRDDRGGYQRRDDQRQQAPPPQQQQQGGLDISDDDIPF